MAEMKVLVESIIEMVYSELSTCISNNKDALNMKVADVLVEQFNDLVKNYADHKDVLKCGKFSDRVVDSIQGTVRSFMRKRDLEQYIDKMT
ncbi:MAG: hypothetical protein Q4G23_05515, partial [Clostridia bacterium]|nr:hypothetical protein [Clostridia bacterium]